MLKTCMRGLAFAVPLFMASSLAIADPVETRQNMMKSVGAATGTLGKMLKGETDYDAALATMAMRVLFTTPSGFVTQFPEGSETGGDTEAAPKIWEDKAGFEKIAMDLQAAALAALPAAGGGLEQLKGAFGPVAQNCKACHEDYRIKKD
ncbi:cytochrome c [Stappia sp. ES.058]|uniref:c-type cytochrome n=1 Tax=Stappia sp. ES.058 TaxID=1881061 RepID=UPI00087A88DD|nr:cytochrome c [Stappia sp. ES.058]SDU21547.1 Cytochrome c556 [Stappia sp. ES.058]